MEPRDRAREAARARREEAHDRDEEDETRCGEEAQGFEEPAEAAIASVKASVFVGTSVDGFIARPDGGLDFLPPGGGEDHGYEAFMATVDALLIGRKTYETVLGFEAWPYGSKPVFVLSTRALAPAPAGAALQRMA